MDLFFTALKQLIRQCPWLEVDAPRLSRTVVGIRRQLTQLRECRALQSQVYQKQVELRLREVLRQLERLSEGRLLFDSTEIWRTVYEDVLSACRVKRYLSVAVIRSDDYWRDPPGEKSLEFNFQLVAHGFYVHRVFIIDDSGDFGLCHLYS